MSQTAIPCLPIPIPQLPALPLPFSFALPGLPGLAIKANVCCLSINLGNLIPPIPLPPLIVNPAFVATIRKAINVVQVWIDQFQLPCPRL